MRSFIFMILFLVAFPRFAESESRKRYVIAGPDLNRIESRTLYHRGTLQSQMRFQRGLTADMNARDAANLRKELGREYLVEEDARVEILGRLRALAIKTTTQPVQSFPWGIDALKARDAWSYNRGAGVKVCVVDTGVQKDHPDLAANIAGGRNFVVQNRRLDPNAYGDDNGHGSHVAGTIAALDNGIGVVGVAPLAKIYAVKVLDRNGSGYMSAVADGIRACVSAGAKVINMSLGSSSDSSLVRDAVKYAAANGVQLFAAAGNESGAVSYPARYPEVNAISAIDSTLQFAYFSNFGPEVDYTAPGVSVKSTTKGSSYAIYSGTSMASPHAAGVAALKISAGKSMLAADNIGLALEKQGLGLVNALKTVLP